MLPWKMVQSIKGQGQERLFNDFFLSADFRNGISGYSLVTLPIFAMFHVHTTEIQFFTVKLSAHSDVVFDVHTFL